MFPASFSRFSSICSKTRTLPQQFSGRRGSSQQVVTAAHYLMGSTLPVEGLVKSVRNIRDLAECAPHMKPGRVFRCALPKEIVPEDVAILRQQLGVTVLIDLRTAEEQEEDAGGAKLWEGGRFVRYTRSLFNCQKLNKSVMRHGSEPITLHHVSFLERFRFYQGLAFRIPITSLLYAITMRLFNQPGWRSTLVKEVNARGLSILYEILLDGAQAEIVEAMRLIAKSARKGSPVMFFCRAGKDRTGMLAMLLLAACGATNKQIITDYTRSDAHHKVAIAGMENKPELAGLDRSKFQGAPEEAIVSALDYVEKQYGGPQQYLDRIGFTYAEQEELRELLTIAPGSEVPAGTVHTPAAA